MRSSDLLPGEVTRYQIFAELVDEEGQVLFTPHGGGQVQVCITNYYLHYEQMGMTHDGDPRQDRESVPLCAVVDIKRTTRKGHDPVVEVEVSRSKAGPGSITGKPGSGLNMILRLSFLDDGHRNATAAYSHLMREMTAATRVGDGWTVYDLHSELRRQGVLPASAAEVAAAAAAAGAAAVTPVQSAVGSSSTVTQQSLQPTGTQGLNPATHTPAGEPLWRVCCVNSRYEVSPSYPPANLVPSTLTDAAVSDSAGFRTKGRFASVTWVHPTNGCPLARCSQPKVGLQGCSNSSDELMLREIGMQPLTNAAANASSSSSSSNDGPGGAGSSRDRMAGQTDREGGTGYTGRSHTSGSSSSMGSGSSFAFDKALIMIIDARSKTAAVANYAKGGGFEGYSFASLHFAGIANIHTMRSAFGLLSTACLGATSAGVGSADGGRRCTGRGGIAMYRPDLVADTAAPAAAAASTVSSILPGGGAKRSSITMPGGGEGVASSLPSPGDRGQGGGAGDKPSSIGSVTGQDKPARSSWSIVGSAVASSSSSSSGGGGSGKGDFGPGSLSDLHASRWLDYISCILAAGLQTANALHTAAKPVVVHCSDGWDRTCQITSTAQLLLDPYYRTLVGFQVLVEKEWVSFGHMFHTRCTREGYKGQESSPVFTQWLDAVWQVMSQMPVEFEFNETLLVLLASEVLPDNAFGTLVFDNAAERERSACTRVSVWTYVNTYPERFTSIMFKPSGTAPSAAAAAAAASSSSSSSMLRPSAASSSDGGGTTGGGGSAASGGHGVNSCTVHLLTPRTHPAYLRLCPPLYLGLPGLDHLADAAADSRDKVNAAEAARADAEAAAEVLRCEMRRLESEAAASMIVEMVMSVVGWNINDILVYEAEEQAEAVRIRSGRAGSRGSNGSGSAGGSPFREGVAGPHSMEDTGGTGTGTGGGAGGPNSANMRRRNSRSRLAQLDSPWKGRPGAGPFVPPGLGEEGEMGGDGSGGDRSGGMQPYSAPMWTPNALAPNCEHCRKAFGFFRRKHHCRECGGVFCSECTPNAVALPHYNMASPQRVCLECEDELSDRIGAASMPRRSSTGWFSPRSRGESGSPKYQPRHSIA